MYRTEIEVIWENEESIRKDILVMLSHKKIESVSQAKVVFPALYDMIMAMEDSVIFPTAVKVLSSIELKDELAGLSYSMCYVDDEIKEE